MSNTLAHRMADYAARLRVEDLPAAAVHEVKRRVIDSLGCALGAWNETPSAVARRVASTISCDNGATLWGTQHRTSPDWAAFANGILVRYFDFNDTYLSKEPAHPSDNIPAAIAVAQASGATGKDLIVAIVLAYEVQCRLCDATSLRKIGWDHVTYGAFSTALASAKLMKLDEARTRHALGIAGVTSAALRQSRVGELSHWKGCAFANAARHGVFAAMLAAEGITGPAPIFEGEKGFEKLVSGPLPVRGPFGADADSIEPPMILRTSIKRWPAEYHSQSAIQAALELRGKIPSTEQIEQIVIESHDAAVDIIGSEPEKWRPQTRETADHSLPYITAAALMDGNITDHQFSPERFTDEKLLELVARVKVVRHAELSGMYPRAVGNIVTLHLKGGQKLTARVDYARGHDRNPMTDEEVEQKFYDLAAARLPRDRAQKVLKWVWQLGEAPSVEGLMSLL